ncbi:MAG: serine/threonine-protein kinase [Gemmatimonadaceae bacterium]
MIEQSERIGPYKVLRLLGEGGMGVVYEAEQTEPVRRRVALKILKIGLDSKAFIARFEVERQALAVMDHASIARVLDAGAVEGRPFYVMELVAGVALTEFCDDHRLTTEARLLLFVEVCNAVQHAHQKGIIHRDLKPSNVLVTRQDDKPVPKVIDFGIAKAVGQRLTDSTFVTRFGEPVGTPAYMSPEQWDAQSTDIDTRTDIYSLGIMLFELLAGKLPYEPDLLVRAGNSAPLLLRLRAPPTPSGLLSSLGAEGSTLAYMRRTDQRSLLRELRGDLDWITSKAIDPDRTRRYATAQELSLDIGRHLRSEPILARPPSARYRAGRFFLRHRIGVTVAALALLTGIGFTTVTAMQARRIERERDRAEGEAAKALALNTFLEETLLSPDPMGGIGRDATMLQALDSAAARLQREKIASPAVEASMKSAIGWAYHNLGLYDKAEPLLMEALRIRQRLEPPDTAGLAHSLTRAAKLDAKLARYGPATTRFTEAVALLRREGSDTSTALASSLVGFGHLMRDRGDTARALTLLQEAQKIYTAAKDVDGQAEVENQLGVLEYQRGNLAQAERYMRSSLDYYRRKLGRHPFVLQGLANIGVVLEDLKRPEEAERAYREALDIGRATLGTDHDMVAATTNNLGVLLSNTGKFDEARSLLREALATDQKKLGRDNPAVATDLVNLSRAICRGSGDFEEGAQMSARAGALFAKHFGAESWMVGQARINRGDCLRRLRRFDEAERELYSGLQLLEKAFGNSHRRIDSARVRLEELERARATAQQRR